MRWYKYTLTTNTQAVDLISDMLQTEGVEGVEIEDKLGITEEERKEVFADILPELHDDGIATISFYIDSETDKNELRDLMTRIDAGMEELKSFVDVGDGTFAVEEINEDDFKDRWKEFFHAFEVDEDIVIKPTWEELPAKFEGARAVLALDPGTAFGTGEHETTRLCMLNIKKYIKEGDSVFDIGCGSGILSILAKKLGAGVVAGTDIDENAVNVSVENCIVNGIGAKRKDDIKKVSDLSGDEIVYSFSDVFESEVRKGICDAFQGGADVVAANILADVIIPICGFVKEIMKEDSVFISSGIYCNKVEDVKKACEENGLKIVEITTMGDWNSFVCKK